MPYHADLRCSYFSIKLNMSWFYESISERNEEIEFGNQDIQDKFEYHIEKAFNDWTVYKVFNHKIGDRDYDSYDNVWSFLYDIANEYSVDKNILFVSTEEEEEEEED